LTIAAAPVGIGVIGHRVITPDPVHFQVVSSDGGTVGAVVEIADPLTCVGFGASDVFYAAIAPIPMEGATGVTELVDLGTDGHPRGPGVELASYLERSCRAPIVIAATDRVAVAQSNGGGAPVFSQRCTAPP
jgi:hypothetical protein